MCENCLYRKRHYLYKGYPVVYLKLPHQYCLNDRDSSVAIQKLVVVSLFLLFLVDHYANLYEFLQLNIPLISYLSLQLSLYVSLYYWATNLKTHRDTKGKQYLSSRRNNLCLFLFKFPLSEESSYYVVEICLQTIDSMHTKSSVAKKHGLSRSSNL